MLSFTSNLIVDMAGIADELMDNTGAAIDSDDVPPGISVNGVQRASWKTIVVFSKVVKTLWLRKVLYTHPQTVLSLGFACH